MSAAVAQSIEGITLVDMEPRQSHPLAAVAGGAAPSILSQTGEVTPMTLLQMAVQQGADLDRLERFMSMVREWKAEAARDAYVADMAKFKLNAPEIYKNKHVASGRNSDGKQGPDYWHADHFTVVMPLVRGLAEHGFSHDWEIDQKDGYVHVTAVVTHRLGHSKRVHMFASADGTGTKNGIQSIGSTKTYLERYTLLAVTGLSTGSLPDPDGRTDDPLPPLAANDDDRARNDPPFYGPYVGDRQQQGAQPRRDQPTDERKTYDPTKFKTNLSAWQSRIENGEQPADRLIAFIESKGVPFTDEQRKTLRDTKVKAK